MIRVGETDITEEVTHRLKEILEPYIGMQDYGNLRYGGELSSDFPIKVHPSGNIFNTYVWIATYNKLDGSNSRIYGDYSRHDDEFGFSEYGKKQKTYVKHDSEPLIKRFELGAEGIKTEREEFLKNIAKEMFSENGSLEDALKHIISYEHPEFGYTEEELNIYKNHLLELKF